MIHHFTLNNVTGWQRECRGTEDTESSFCWLRTWLKWSSFPFLISVWQWPYLCHSLAMANFCAWQYFVSLALPNHFSAALVCLLEWLTWMVAAESAPGVLQSGSHRSTYWKISWFVHMKSIVRQSKQKSCSVVTSSLWFKGRSPNSVSCQTFCLFPDLSHQPLELLYLLHCAPRSSTKSVLLACTGFDCRRVNFLHSGPCGAVVWICDLNSADNTGTF